METELKQTLQEEAQVLQEVQQIIQEQMEERMKDLGTLKQEIVDYRKYLCEDILPFWIKYSLDKEEGGILTCLDKSGNVKR